MAKRFKLRISRVITTTFQSCRSKDPSSLPENPVPSFFRLTPRLNSELISVDFPDNPSPPPPSRVPHGHDHHHHHRSSFRRSVSSAFISVGCGFSSSKSGPSSTSTMHDSDEQRSRSNQFKWRKEEKWHVVANIYEENRTPRHKIRNSSVSGDSDNDGVLALPPNPPPVSLLERKRRGRKKKKSIPSRLRMSTSSADSGLFSSEAGDERDDDEEEEEEGEETETLVSSSRSFSTDSSSEFNPQLETIRETPFTRRHRRTKKKSKMPSKRSLSKNIYRPSSVSEGDSPARLSVFKKLIPCTVDGKVKESFAIVKKSEDPYEDFKRSMMEMILEKQMFEEKDLEQLLQCFLSLNSRHYHGLIIEAFAEIWEAMFCSSSARNSTHHRRAGSKQF